MKKIVLLILSIISCSIVKAASIENDKYDLWFLNPEYEDTLSIPSEYLKHAVISVKNATSQVTYRITKGSNIIEVNEDGEVTPHLQKISCYKNVCTSWSISVVDKVYHIYEEGQAIVNVKVGNESFDVTINTHSYANKVARDTMDEYINTNGLKDLSPYGQALAIKEYIESTPYDAYNKEYAGNFFANGANSQADAEAINYMFQKLGLRSHIIKNFKGVENRPGVAVYLPIDEGQKPTLYYMNSTVNHNVKSISLSSSDNDFYIENHNIIQYDGEDEIVNIPDNPRYTTIKEFAFANGISDNSKIKTINIKDNINDIYPSAFSYVKTLTNINVSSTNEYYESLNGVLYTKNLYELVAYPIGRTDTQYKIPASTKEISSYAFYYADNLEKITIPEGITSIGKYAFYSMDNEKIRGIEIPSSVTTIGDNAIYNKSNTYLVILNPNASLGTNLCDNNTPIYGLPNSTTEEYASINNCPFYTVTEANTTDINELDIKISDVNNGEKSNNEPNITIKDGNYTLIKGIDYKIELSNNQGGNMLYPKEQAQVKIIGINKYRGNITKNYYIINYIDINETEVEKITDKYAFLGPALDYLCQPKVNIYYNKTKLVEGVDYTLSYYQNTGSPSVVYITGKGKFRGTRFVEYEILSDNEYTIFLDDIKLSLNSSKNLVLKSNPSVIIPSSEISWESEDPTIATIDPNGRITALKKGTVTIKASFRFQTATATITITDEIPSLKGDLNNNGEIDLTDVLIELKIYFRNLDATDYQNEVGDMNDKDGITLTDVLMLLKAYFNK